MHSAASNTGIFGRLANASLSLVSAGARLIAKPESRRATAVLASASAVQSQRIRLRMLRSAGRLDEIAGIAQTTDEVEIVRAAMRELTIAAQEQREAVLALLTRLGEGTSSASLSALIVMLNIDAFKEANAIFRAKVAANQLGPMLAAGTARFFHIIDIVSCLDRVFRTQDGPVLFTRLYAAMPPEKQPCALAEIFGDTEPGGYRYGHDQNSISGEIKKLALQAVLQLPGREKERPLWYATRERDDVIAYNATIALMEYWQGEGKVPMHLDPFPMLDVALLFHLCAKAAAFRWRTQVDLAALSAQEVLYLEELASLPPQSHRRQLIEGQLDDLRAQMRQETEARLKSIQPIVNEITKALNLPFAELEASDDVSCAAYALGTGRVLINRRTLLDQRPLGEDVMSSLLHELCHMGQDVTLIRMICDDLNLVFGQHGKLLYSLWDRYSSLMGYAPDHIFLLAVLRLRNDVPLTAVERERGNRLVAAANQANVTHHRKKYITSRMSHLLDSYESLASGRYDAHLLGVLRNLQQLQGMFDAGQIPEVLVYELQKCRDELQTVVDELVDQRVLSPRKDFIAGAESLWHSEHHSAVEPIALKVRQLLLETLDEEIEALHRIESRVVRMGYHEDEAYTVSDRVEVIVKAILKGWYA